jgi:hypothetical protein
MTVEACHRSPVASDDSCQGGCVKPLNAKLNPICYLPALLGAHHFLHVSRIRVNYGPWSEVIMS